MKRRELLTSLTAAPLAVLVAGEASSSVNIGPLLASQAVGALELARLRIVLDLVRDGIVTTPANYTQDKVDYLDLATVNKYVLPFLRVWSKFTQEQLDAMTVEQQALAVMDRLKWFFRYAYVSEQSDMKTSQQTAIDTSTATARTDLGEDEFSLPEPE